MLYWYRKTHKYLVKWNWIRAMRNCGGRQIEKQEKEKREVTEVIILRTRKRLFTKPTRILWFPFQLKLFSKYLIQYTHRAVRDGPHQVTKSVFQAPDASLDVGSWANSYANQKSLLPWLARSREDGVRVIIGVKVAVDKSVKDEGGEPIYWRSHIISLE